MFKVSFDLSKVVVNHTCPIPCSMNLKEFKDRATHQAWDMLLTKKLPKAIKAQLEEDYIILDDQLVEQITSYLSKDYLEMIDTSSIYEPIRTYKYESCKATSGANFNSEEELSDFLKKNNLFVSDYSSFRNQAEIRDADSGTLMGVLMAYIRFTPEIKVNLVPMSNTRVAINIDSGLKVRKTSQDK